MLWAQAHPFSQSGICLLWIKRFSYTSVFLPVPTFMLVTTFVASSIAFCWCRRRDFGALLPEPSTVEMLRDLVIITLITFLHFPFSNASSRCLHKWTKSCVNCNSLIFSVVAFQRFPHDTSTRAQKVTLIAFVWLLSNVWWLPWLLRLRDSRDSETPKTMRL